MKLREKMISTFLLMAIFMIVLNIVNLRTTKNITSEYDKIFQNNIISMADTEDLKTHFSQIAMDALTLSSRVSQAGGLQKNLALQGEVRKTRRDLLNWRSSFASSFYIFNKKPSLAKKLALLEKRFRKKALELINPTTSSTKKDHFLKKQNQFKKLAIQIVHTLSRLSMEQKESLQNRLSRVYQITRHTYQINFSLMASLLFFSILLGFITAHTIASPIVKLKDALEAVGMGNLNTFLSISSKDEIGHVSRSFNKMVADLRAITISRSHLDRILQTILNAVIVLDPSCFIQRSNKALLRLLSYKEADLKGESLQLVLSDFQKEPLLSGEIYNEERELIHGDGTRIPVLFSSSPMREEGGCIEGIVCVFQDIREQKNLEETILKISDREQLRIARDLHDSLGQHLGGLQHMSEALSQQLQKENSQQTPLAQRLALLLREAFLKTRSLSHSLYSVELEEHGIITALKELISNMETIFQVSCQLTYKSDFAISNPTAKVHLYRIAQEATHNAIKHGQADRISLSLSKKASQITFCIEDNGRGFRSEEVVSGMGLQTMEYRAKLIRGVLKVHSEPGQGTRVICVFDDHNPSSKEKTALPKCQQKEKKS